MSSNQLQAFTNTEFGTLNVLIENGREYFPATECARILGYVNPRDAIKRHCKGEGVVKRDGVSFTTNQHGVTTGVTLSMNYITEGNLYRLITNSKLPAAERFESWVFDEVLPSIRRNGAYVPDVKELVVLTTRAVVMELLPYINRADAKKRVRRKRVLYKIETLEPDIREEIDDMLLANRHTYIEICAHFAKTYDIRFSKSALGRYAQYVYDRAEE